MKFKALLLSFLVTSNFELAFAAPGDVLDHHKIADGLNGFIGGTLAEGHRFGASCTVLGDLDGDGVPDIAVGSYNDSTREGGGGFSNGALHILFLNADGTVKSHSKIADGLNGLSGGTLENFNFFGSSCTLLGDLDGDGLPEIAVGAVGDNTRDGGGGSSNGAVYILFLNADGTVKSQTKIADGLNGLTAGTLENFVQFGGSCTALSDLDGNGVLDMAVGVTGDNTRNGGGGGSSNGALYILYLNADGTVKSHVKIADGVNGLTGGTIADLDRFGHSCTMVGDLDRDGVPEIAVGAYVDDTANGSSGGNNNGALYVLFLNADGTVKRHSKIADGLGGLAGGTLANGSQFGESCTVLGDLDADGFPEILVGASADSTENGGSSGDRNGAVYVLFLDGDGMVKSHSKIADGLNGLAGGTLNDVDFFGASCTLLGDADGDGVVEIAVGAYGDNTKFGGSGAFVGAVHILSLGDLPLTVTTTDDEFDTPSDDTGSTGFSLREAIRDAKATGEFQTIRFDPALDGETLVLGGTEIDLVDQSLRVTGEGLSLGIEISGNDQSRIFVVDSDSALSVECLKFSHGGLLGVTGAPGGAISNFGSLTIIDCLFEECRPGGRGGAVASTGVLKIEGSTFANNSNTTAGGALYCTGSDSESTITNTTFYGNEAGGDGGGAIDVGSSAEMFLRHCTIVGNRAPAGAGGGIRESGSALTVIINSIVTDNEATTDPQLNGSVGQGGMNLIGTPANLSGPGDFGGKTPTMLPLAGSSAVDGGTFFPLPAKDQRGVFRIDGMPDLGAVEIERSAAAAASAPDNSTARAVLLKKIKKLKKKLKNAKRKGQVAKVKKFKKQIKKLTKQLRAL